LSWPIVGNALRIPLGIALLARLPATPPGLLIGVSLLLAAGLPRSGFSLALSPSVGGEIRRVAGDGRADRLTWVSRSRTRGLCFAQT